MLASLSGSLALAVGLAVMLLPLLSPELSRPRDAVWGAVLLLLGLVLVTGADRLSGSPMLAVLCGGLLIGRMGGEVMQLRWHQLTQEEQQRLGSLERWRSSASELAASLGRGGSALSESAASLGAALGRGHNRSKAGGTTKRWVRPDAPATPAAAASAEATAPRSPGAQQPAVAPQQPEQPEPPSTVVVHSFAEIDALIKAAGGGQATASHSEAG
ncbi:MAG: Ycf66 family protein [Cyanobium sp.]